MEMSRGQQRPVCWAPSRAGSPRAQGGSRSRVRTRPHTRGIRSACFSERLSDPNPLRILPSAGSRLVCAHHPPPVRTRSCVRAGAGTAVSEASQRAVCHQCLGRRHTGDVQGVSGVFGRPSTTQSRSSFRGAVNGAGGSLHTASWGRSHRQERPMWDPRARNGCERLEGASIKRGHQSGTGDPPHARDHMTHVT